MVSAGGILAGKAFIDLVTRDNRLVRGLDSAGRRIRAWGMNVSRIGLGVFAAGMGILAPLLGAVKNLSFGFADIGDKLHKMSLRTGMSSEALSELGFAAEQSGSSLDDVGNAVMRMNRRLGRITAGLGSGQQVAAMEALGLTAEKLRRMRPEDRFMALAEAIKTYGDDAAAAGLAQRAFGTAVDRILPLLKEGAGGIAALRQEARRLGLSVSGEEAQAAADFTDAWNRVERSFKAVVFVVGSAVAPMLTRLFGTIKSHVVAASNWIRQNKALVSGLFKLGAAIAAGGAVLITLGGAIAGIGFVLSGLASIVGLVVGGFTLIGSVVAAVLTPMGLLTVGAGVLAARLIHSTGAVAKAAAWLGGVFEWLRGVVSIAWQGISDAIAAGDLRLAFEVAVAGLRVVWIRAVNFLHEKWIAFKETFSRVWASATHYLARGLTQAWATVQMIWVRGVGLMQTAWAKLSAGVVSAWKWAEERIAQGIGYLIAKMEGIDPAQVSKLIAENYAGQRAERELNTEKRLEAIRTGEETDLAGIYAAEQAALAELDKAHQEAQAARRRGHEAEMGDAEERLAAAEDELAAAAERARKAREASAAGKPKEMERFEELQDRLAGLEAGGQEIEAAGTFSAFAAARMTGGGLQDRIARATESTARGIDELIDVVSENSLDFA